VAADSVQIPVASGLIGEGKRSGRFKDERRTLWCAETVRGASAFIAGEEGQRGMGWLIMATTA
jgi:hypothetical protein